MGNNALRRSTELPFATARLILYFFLEVFDPEDHIFNGTVSGISLVLWETTLTISDSILRQAHLLNLDIMRVVSLGTTEIITKIIMI